jgi:hypothetical protein
LTISSKTTLKRPGRPGPDAAPGPNQPDGRDFIQAIHQPLLAFFGKPDDQCIEVKDECLAPLTQPVSLNILAVLTGRLSGLRFVVDSTYFRPLW